eukprot:3317037-Prymnesium_polylepis.1
MKASTFSSSHEVISPAHLPGVGERLFDGVRREMRWPTSATSLPPRTASAVRKLRRARPREAIGREAARGVSPTEDASIELDELRDSERVR